MAFLDDTVLQAWKRAEGKCECVIQSHRHEGAFFKSTNRCDKLLTWGNRGRESGQGAWEAHHKVSVESGGPDSLSNCEILCWDCHSKTF